MTEPSNVAAITTEIASALDGRSAGVLVRAPSGTARRAAIVEALGHTDVTNMLSVVADSLRRAEPFSTLRDLLTLEAHHAHAGGTTDRAVIDDALDVVEDILATGSVVLWVDDVDMADPLSIHALCAIARTFVDRPCSVIATVAPSAPAPTGSRLVRAGLAAVTLVADDDTRTASVLLADLEEGTESILRAAAVLGSPFQVEQLAVATDLTPIALLAPLDHAISAGVLDDNGTQLVFASTAVVSALRVALDNDERRALHESVARSLEAAGAPSATIAMQHVEARAADGHVRLGWIREAVAATAASLPDVAVDLLERAGGLEPEGSAARVALAAATIAPLVRVGRVADALSLAASLDVDVLSPVEALGALAGAAMGSERVGNHATAASMWEQAADVAGLPDRLRAEPLARAAMAWVLAGDTRRAEALARDAETRGRLHGDAAATSVAVATLTLIATAAGDTSSAVRRGEEAVAIDAAAARGWSGHPDPHAVLGTVLLADDRLDDALRSYERGRRTANAAGITTSEPLFEWDLALCHLLAGALDDAVASVDAGLAMADAAETDLGVPLAHAVAARVALHRGDVPAAQEAVARADAVSLATGRQRGNELVEWVRALLLQQAGQHSRALEVLRAAWDENVALRYLPSYRLLGLDLVRAAVAARASDVANDALAALVDGAQATGSNGPHAAAALGRSLVDRDAAQARRSVELSRKGPRRLQLADALETYATLLVDSGDTRAAGDALQEALSIYDACGASGDAMRCGETMRALGIRRRSAASRPATGWDALTDTETRVARLVASGLANREVAEELYVSRHTVESHLRQIFVKLHLRSRVELGNFVTRHG